MGRSISMYFHVLLFPTHHKMITKLLQLHKAIKAEHVTKPNHKVVHFLSPGYIWVQRTSVGDGPKKKAHTDVLGVLDDHASALIHLQFDATWNLICQQSPDQNAQAALFKETCDDAVIVLLPPDKALRYDLQVMNSQLALAFRVRPRRISEMQGVCEVLEHALHLLARVPWAYFIR